MNYHSFRYVIKMHGVQPKAGFNNAGDAGDYLEALRQSDHPMRDEFQIVDQQEAIFDNVHRLNHASELLHKLKTFIEEMGGNK